MMRELTKSDLLAEIEEEIEIGLNALAHLAVEKLEGNSARQTGFYASSWKASPSLINYDDDIYAYIPWAGLRRKVDAGQKVIPQLKRRHVIPRFNHRQPVYIANTVGYSETAFAKSPGITTYATFGIKKDIDRVFSDQGILTWRANIPKQ